MLRVVLDINILVSALLKPESNPARILDMVISGQAQIFLNASIILEYEAVLSRPRFNFNPLLVKDLIQYLTQSGYIVTPNPVFVPFTDESDRKFYEVAVYTSATLITGNVRHFPESPIVISPAEFLISLR